MKLQSALMMIVAVVLTLSFGLANAQEMTKEQWQQEMNKFTQMRNDLQAKVKTLGDGNGKLAAQSTKLDADYEKCVDDLYALVGSDRQKAAAYGSEIEAAEQKPPTSCVSPMPT